MSELVGLLKQASQGCFEKTAQTEAHHRGRGTPILSSCHGIFTDRLLYIMLVFFRAFSEAKALSIIRALYWHFPGN